MEERRMRVDSDPFGRLFEEFLGVAYSAHPYGRPLVGWPSDIETTTIKDTEAFYRRYYTNENFTFAIVRDVDAGRMRSEEHTSELQSRGHLVCRLLLAKKNII